VVTYLTAVGLIVATVTLVTGALIRSYTDPVGQSAVIINGAYSAWLAENGLLLAGIAGITAALILLASLYRIATLSRGGAQVARMLGATEVTADSPDPLRRRLINVIEEMAIASGLPVPAVFVLEQEQGINAFAAGLTPADAAIAVTRGALERLNRAELQGVVAHEFSHVLNGDMRLNLRLMGLSFGILVLALLGRWLLRTTRYSRRSRSGGGVSAAIGLGLILIIIGYIGLFFARIIKAGVSRQREVLADASAVQFTRDSSGLAEALKKIGGYTGGLVSRDTEEIAHMLFSRGSRAFRGWFATHPPLDERIRVLDPTFTPGDYPSTDEPLPLIEGVEADLLAPSLAAHDGAVGEGEILGQAGKLASRGFATALRAAIPEELYQTARSPEGSLLLVVALALSREEPFHERQLHLLEQRLGRARTVRCQRLAEELNRMNDKLKLPLFELSVPALKQRPPEQLEFLYGLLKRLADITPSARLFDYVLLRMLQSYVQELPDSGVKPPKAARGLGTAAALVTLLKCVAAFGHADGTAALAAFRAGLAAVGRAKTSVPEPSFEPMKEARSLLALDAALARLARLRPRAKERVLAAVLACIRHDHRIDIAELELFRAIAATLGCPLPPAMTIRAEV